MRVILTRHYKTQSNEEGLILGWGDSPPCLDWKSDTDFVYTRLHKQGVKLDSICSSDLQRSRQTAMNYAELFGKPVANGTPELNEINYADVQTMDKSLVARLYPEHKKNPDLVYPGGESFRQMQQRSVSYLSSMLLAAPQQTVLIVSHAGVIRGIISHFLGLEFAANLQHKIPFRYIGDFQFEGVKCRRYDELGEPSGFVTGGTIDLPFACPGVAS